MVKLTPDEELFLEESISTLSKEKLNALELPLSRRAFSLVLILVLLAGLIVASRILFLEGWRGSFYKARAAVNIGKEVYLPPARGVVYDRFGKPLVENVPTFSVSVKVKDIASGRLAQAGLFDLLGLLPEEVDNQLKNLDLEKTSSLVIARDVEPEKIIQLKSLNLDEVEIIDDYKRLYLDGPVFAHILGYTGPGSTNETEGKVGLESYYDQFVRGKQGEYIIYQDAFGNLIDKKLINLPENGSSLSITIDSGLQKYFYYRLWEAIASLGSQAAVGIALNPQNGEVLSFISLPSFDNNLFGKTGNNAEKINLLNSPTKPLFNRGVSGAYNPGSTIKPLMALAALTEGVIGAKKEIYSAGFIEIPNPYYPDQPSVFLDWKPHGWVDLHSALARSCNVYFYAVGGGLPANYQPNPGSGGFKGLGIEKIKEYWQKFGFGKKTGIDLTSENEGFLPDPEIKEQKTGDIWRLGDTYNVSIGQGDFLVTPIQLISQIASIANNGKFYKPFLVKNIVDVNGNKIENNKEVLIDYSYLGEQLKEVEIGMEDAVRKSYGTAHLLSDIPVGIAAKTGSAQIANNTKTNAFFVGYMPAYAEALAGKPAVVPEIAILVLVENAKEGSLNAVPVAKDVLEWYYYNRLISNF